MASKKKSETLNVLAVTGPQRMHFTTPLQPAFLPLSLPLSEFHILTSRAFPANTQPLHHGSSNTHSPTHTHRIHSVKHRHAFRTNATSTSTQYIFTLIYPTTPTILHSMSLMSNVNRFHFRLATGMNPREEELKDIMALWLFNNRLRQGLYQSSLTGDNYKVFVAELRTYWDGALGNFKRKAMGEGVKQDDTSQTLVVAKQVRKVVETYFANNPKAVKDAKTIPLHIYLCSIFVVESVFEVQNDFPRVFARYVLSDSVQRLDADELFFVRHGDSVLDLRERELRDALEKEFAASKKLVLENRALKRELDVMDNLRDQLDCSKRDEELAQDKIDEAESKLTEQIIWTCDQREGYERQLEGVTNENVRLEREVDHFKGRAMDAEKQVEELKKLLSNLGFSQG